MAVYPSDKNQTAYNGKNRNSGKSELWSDRSQAIAFLAYLLWDLKGYSVVRDVLHLVC
ncbi:high light inducible protein [Nostoc sp.]|uniref:high light inducible protein n=1 Tax=Nostoc sp. TaxID=1180 RepID=UPI002FF70236